MHAEADWCAKPGFFRGLLHFLASASFCTFSVQSCAGSDASDARSRAVKTQPVLKVLGIRELKPPLSPSDKLTVV